MRVQLLDIILIILFFQLLTIVPFLLLQKTNRGVSNKFLGLLLISKALCISNFLSFRLKVYTLEFFPHLFYFGSSFTILWGPLLYLYVKSLTKSNFKLSPKDIIHFTPFLLHFLFVTLNFHLNSTEAKRIIIESGGIFTQKLWTYYYWFLYLYILIYSLATFPIIKKYHSKLQNSFSSVASINLNWMVFIVIGFILKVGFDVWYKMADSDSISKFIAIYSSRFILFIFVNIMIYKGLKQPSIWLGEMETENKIKEPLSKALQDKYLEKLLSYASKYKPYLNPEITLEELSNLVDIPPRSLSWILNERLNQSFYDFINSYRIKESEKIFREMNSDKKTILEVLFEVGFNSKSSFNTAFKKYTEMTPTQYKKLISDPLN